MGTARKILTVLMFMTSLNIWALTAGEVIAKAATQARNAKGISAMFTISSGNTVTNGTMKIAGSKFSIVTPGVCNWYNGKNMWVYNASSNETTLIVPTKYELAESNPFEYIKSYSTDYSVTFSTKKATGKYILKLTPKSKNSQINNIEITLNSKSYMPESFIITPKSGSKSTVTVKSLDYNASLKSSDFEYPKAKYPKVQIIDLR